MATPAILTFPSNLAPVVPTFVGNGSKIDVPDLQVVFWGPYWPGTGQLTVGDLMQAVTTLVNGPYLDGLKQYGYTGPVNVRQPIVNTGNPSFTYPAPGPNVNQLNTAIQAVFNLVDTLRQNNSMGDVTSNHDLIVMTFIDPSYAFPQIFNATGGVQTTVYGEHSTYLASRLLAPAIRFSYGIVFTQPLPGISAFDQATVTFSHELAEAITNPFNGSGWVETAPASASGGGEIGDVCNNTKCVVDGIAVQPYWGIQQAACILPIEQRHLSLDQTQTKHVSQDGPTQYATVNMGPLCGSGKFDYVVRTWDNAVAVTAVHPGYQVPVFTWTINGTPIPGGASNLTVPSTWDSPTGSADLSVVRPFTGQVKIPLDVATPVAHPPIAPPPSGPAMPLIATTSLLAVSLAGLADRPIEDPLHRNATLRLAVFGSVLSIECGPNEGNVSLTVGCQAIENWDNIKGTTVTTQNSTSTIVLMTNQEIVWGQSFQQAANDCYSKTHKAEGGVIPRIPINPGDPLQNVTKVAQVQETQQVQQVKQVGQINRLK